MFKRDICFPKIDKEIVDIIPDLKTADEKYNFTDGVGQISSELNLLVSDYCLIYSYRY